MHKMNKQFGAIGDAYDTAPVLDHLACFLCKKLLRDAVQAPCCKTNFCDDCIQHTLLNPDDITLRLKCPKCKAVLIPDKLEANQDLRQKVVLHLRQFAQSRNEGNENEQVPIPVTEPIHVTERYYVGNIEKHRRW
jgi:protein MPE1